MRPEERVTLRAVREEMRLRKKGIARFNKRWRSWAQNRVRQFRLPLPVTLTSDTALMDATYITACVQKAAALRKHDVKLWFGYSKRILELRGELQPDQLGYIMWGYGHSGASSFLDASFYREMLPTIKEQVPNFQSHALMSMMLGCHEFVRAQGSS
ncbi:ppa1 [Symbiodinium natans]|uniref:Ppa1 protein n=1 Tax=Symbiodinium natans TaxID=878477 RepID=A0A812KLC4_9DINO|nr:ppa1 [Symbiodinium natans]